MADPRATDPVRARIAEITNWPVSRCWSTEMQRTTDALTAVLDELDQAEMAAEFMEATHRLVSDMRTRRVREAIATALGMDR